MKQTAARSIAIAALVVGGSMLLDTGTALAQSCSPSSAPKPTDGRVSGAWWSRYAKWCSECGGTPYQDNTGGGCRPGPNWGGKSGGAAASSSGDAATDAGRIAADMFSRLNPQTNAQAVLAVGGAVVTGILSASIAEIMKGPSPEQIRQRQIQEEFARQEEARLARERAEAERQAHLRVMSMLKGTGTWDGQMALKTDTDASALQIKAGDNFFRGSTSPGTLALKTGESADPHFQQQQQDLNRALGVAQMHADLISDGEREKALSNLIMGKGFALVDVKEPKGVPIRSEDVSQFAVYRQKFLDAFERVEVAKEKMEKAGNDKELVAQARKVLEESIKDMKKMLPPEQQQPAQPPKSDKKTEEEDDKLKQANKLFDESSQMDAKADKALQDAKKGYEDSAKEWQNVRRDTFEFLNRLAKSGETANASAAK